MSLFKALILSLRPRQWTKNLILYAAYVFSIGDRTLSLNHEIQLLSIVTTGFLLFCAISSSIYLMNDILDRKADCLHPKKKFRPIASGALPVSIAWTACLVIAVTGLIGAFSLNSDYGWILLQYFFLFVLYSVLLKKVIILDTLIIALGFVLRAVAGAIVLGVGISVWLVICTVFLALFLGFSKRRSELVALGKSASDHRAALGQYSIPHIDIILGICASLSIVCYTMYSLSDRSMSVVGPDSLLTLPFVIFGIFRYLFIVSNDFGGDDPASTLLSDVPLLISVIGWLGFWLYLRTVQPGILSGIIIL